MKEVMEWVTGVEERARDGSRTRGGHQSWWRAKARGGTGLKWREREKLRVREIV